MRSISADLLAKIQKSQQTIYQNANPALKVLLSKGFRKDLFKVYTIHNDDLLEELDVAVKRIDTLGIPDKVYVAYIQDGVAHVKSKDLPYDETLPWNYEFEIGTASEVAVEFDGYWEREGTSGRWNLITPEFPYIFKVVSGELFVQLWDGSPITLATGVSKISAVRGWKSIANSTNDDGLIIAYIKSGSVYYRNLCEQPNGSLAWETEKQITTFTKTAVDISTFRTNDFRVGFVVQNNDGTVELLVTTRTWVGFGIDEKISVSMQNFSIDLIPIEYNYTYHTEKIAVSIENFEINLCPFIEIGVIDAYHPEDFDTVIVVEFDRNINGDMTGLQTAFTVTDGNSNSYSVISTERESLTSIKLNMASFIDAVGDITVSYVKQAGVIGNYSGNCWFDVENFLVSFTPDFAPPIGYHTETIAVSMQNFSIDLVKIDKTEAYHDEKIAVSMQNFSIELINIDDLET